MCFGSYREIPACHVQARDRNSAASQTTPGGQAPRRAEESDGVHRRVHATAGLSVFVLWWRRLGSCYSKLVLGGRRKKAVKCHAHGTATAMQLFLGRSLGFRRSWRILAGWRNWAYDRHYVFFLIGSTIGVRCAMKVCSRGRGCFLGCHSLRSTINRQGDCRRECPNTNGLPRGRWASGNMPCQLVDCTPYFYSPFQSIRIFESICTKICTFGTYFSIRPGRLCPRPQLQMRPW